MRRLVVHNLITFFQIWLPTIFSRLSTLCNILNFQLIDDSHTTTLHAVTLHSTSLLVKTFHRSEPSIGSPFRDLENKFCLLLGSMTSPTNQHKDISTYFVLIHTFFRKLLRRSPIPQLLQSKHA